MTIRIPAVFCCLIAATYAAIAPGENAYLPPKEGYKYPRPTVPFPPSRPPLPPLPPVQPRPTPRPTYGPPPTVPTRPPLATVPPPYRPSPSPYKPPSGPSTPFKPTVPPQPPRPTYGPPPTQPPYRPRPTSPPFRPTGPAPTSPPYRPPAPRPTGYLPPVQQPTYRPPSQPTYRPPSPPSPRPSYGPPPTSPPFRPQPTRPQPTYGPPPTFRPTGPAPTYRPPGTPPPYQPRPQPSIPSGEGRPFPTYGENDHLLQPHKPAEPFDFKYSVKDEYGNDYSHNAINDGDTTNGEYRVQLPDGRTQVVKYVANWASGFHAKISYEGQPTYRPQPIPSGGGYPSARPTGPTGTGTGQQYQPGGGYKY